MNELDSVVLGIAEGRAGVTVHEEAAPAVEAAGHSPAGAGQLWGTRREKTIPGLLDLLVVAANR
jgi:hypothetical protein